MLGLPDDVAMNQFDLGRTQRERPVALLPRELRVAERAVNEARRRRLQLSREVGDREIGAHRDQRMNMARDAADRERNTFEFTRTARDVAMDARCDRWMDPPLPQPRRPHEMNDQLRV